MFFWRSTWWHRLSLCVAGVALGDINLHFVWQAWHLWYWAASCVAFQCMFCLVGTCVRSCRARCYSSIVEVILSVRSPRTRSLSTFSVNTRFACQVRVCKIQKVTLCHGLQKFLWLPSCVSESRLASAVLSLKCPCLFPLADCHGVRHVLCVATQRTRAYIHTYTHTRIHACMHACMNTYIHTYIHTYTHTRIHAYMHACIHTYINTYIHTYAHTYLHTYIHTYTHTRIHAYIHAYIHTQIHKYTYTHAHIQTYKQLSHTQVFHTYLSPSRVSFLPFPFRLHLSFVAYWKKLTCGVFRSFDFK